MAENKQAAQPQTYTELDAEQQSLYTPQYQNKGINALFTVSDKTKPSSLTTDGEAIATIPTADTDVIAIVEQYSDKELSPNNLRCLEYALNLLTAGLTYNEKQEGKLAKSRKIALDINEYMAWRGIKDKKKLRQEVTDFVKALYNVSLSWEQEIWEVPEGKKRKQKIVHPYKLRILDAQDGKIWQNGKAYFNFAYSFVEALAQSQIAPTPNAIGKISLQANPNSLHFIKKIMAHYNMNIGKANEHIIGVKTLVDSSPNLPKYEELKSSGKIYERIISRFNRDMDHLVEVKAINKWYYCDSNGDEDTAAAHCTDYKAFINSRVYFELIPDTLLDEMRTKKLDGKEKNKQAKEQREQKNKSKK